MKHVINIFVSFPWRHFLKFGDDIDANVYVFNDLEDQFFKQTYFRYTLKATNTKRVKFVIKTYAWGIMSLMEAIAYRALYWIKLLCWTDPIVKKLVLFGLLCLI